jgi:hypothetical protein
VIAPSNDGASIDPALMPIKSALDMLHFRVKP